MVTKTINIQVSDAELDVLIDKLKDAGIETDNLGKSAEKSQEKYSNSIKKNSRLITELDKLTGGLASSFLDVADGIGKTNISLKGVQAALVATGIGAFVVALGLVVAYWGEIKGLVTGVSVELQDQIELQQEISREAEYQLELFEAGENILRLQGKSEQEIIELKKERIQQVLETTKAELEYQKQQLNSQEEAEKNAMRIFNGLTLIGTKVITFISEQVDALLGGLGIDIGLTEKVTSIRGSIFDSLFGNKEGIAERKQEIEELTKTIIQQQDKLAQIELNKRENTRGADQEGVKPLPLTGLAGFDNLTEVLDAEFNALALAETARTNLEDANSKLRIARAQEEANAKIAALDLVSEALRVAGRLAGEQTGLGKTLAVASATIATYQSAVLAYKSQLEGTGPAGPYLGIAAAGIAIASGLANVKSILSVKVPGIGGGAGASLSTPPAFNVVQSNPQNQLNQELLANNDEPVQAFVVDKEVTSAQEMRRNKVESSSI